MQALGQYCLRYQTPIRTQQQSPQKERWVSRWLIDTEARRWTLEEGNSSSQGNTLLGFRTRSKFLDCAYDQVRPI